MGPKVGLSGFTIHKKRLKFLFFLFGFPNIGKRNHVLTHEFAETWKIQTFGETGRSKQIWLVVFKDVLGKF